MASIPPLLIPKALKKGDTIAFISPSARLNTDFPTPLARSKAFFESLGYPVKIIYAPLPPTATYQAKTTHIAQELHTAFLAPEIKCIISTLGGTTANEILRSIDYTLIRNNPKIFVGYSDITHLIYAFYTQAGLRSFVGPSALSEFSEFPIPPPFTTSHFLQVLSSQPPITGQQIPRSTTFAPGDPPFFLPGQKEDSQELRETAPTPPPVWLRPGTAEGPIMGGTLRKLVSLSGTPYMLPGMHSGAIFFFEVSGGENGTPMPLYRIRSDIVDLVNAGVFDGIKGLVVGRTYLFDAVMNERFMEMLLEVLGEWTWPVLFGVDVGHTSPMLTVPFGARTRLDSVKDEFCFLEEGVI